MSIGAPFCKVIFVMQQWKHRGINLTQTHRFKLYISSLDEKCIKSWIGKKKSPPEDSINKQTNSKTRKVSAQRLLIAVAGMHAREHTPTQRRWKYSFDELTLPETWLKKKSVILLCAAVIPFHRLQCHGHLSEWAYSCAIHSLHTASTGITCI